MVPPRSTRRRAGSSGSSRGRSATLGTSGLSTIAEVAQGLASIAVVTVLGAMLAFYFLRDGGGTVGPDRWGSPGPPRRPSSHAAGVRAFEVMGGYMGGTAAISFVGSASQFVIMVILGIPLALPVFVLSFFLCFIPYIGGFISTGIALLLTVAFGTPTADRGHDRVDAGVQHRDRERRQPAGVRTDRPHPPGGRARRDPGRRRRSRACWACSSWCRSSASWRRRGGRSCR